MRHAIAIFVILVIATSVGFATGLSTCSVISSPGSYQLTSNVVGAPFSFNASGGVWGDTIGKACIVINAPDVTFDCNGHSMTKTGTFYFDIGVFVNDSASRVTVQNCPSISKYAYAVYAFKSGDNVITNITVSQTGGVFLENTSNNSVIGNTLFDLSDNAILILSGTRNRVIGNRISNSASSGIAVVDGADNSLVANNNITNTSYAFNMEDTDSNTVANNSAVNGYYGFYISNNNIPGGNTLFINNTAYNNSGPGLFMYGTTGNSFINNTIQENGWNADHSYPYDIYLANYVAEPDCNNVMVNTNGSGGRSIIYANGTVNLSSIEASEIILCNADGSTLSNVTVHGSDAAGNNGIIMRDTDNSVITNYVARNTAFGIEIDASQNNLYANNTFFNNSLAGYEVYDSSNNNVFLNNSVDNVSTWSAFSFIYSLNVSLINNTVSNSPYSFYLFYGGTYSLSGNRAYNNVRGSIIHDATSASLSNEHYYNNTYDLDIIESYGGTTTFNATGIILDNPAGNYQNFTNLSINDTLTNAEYTISWSGQPAAPPSSNNPFAQKYINITPVSGSISIDSVMWRWNSTEVSDGGYNESRFTILKYDGGTWSRLSPTLSTSAHTLTLTSLNPASVYGIMEMNGTDTTPPAVALNSPGEGDTLTNSTVAFNFTATDDVSATMACTLYINGTANQTNSSVLNNTPTVFQVSGIRNGAHNWHVRCSDDAANSGTSETRNLTMDYPTGCVVINSPGTTILSLDGEGAPYDLLGGKACVVISSSDVLFDCNGHSILNDGTPSAYGIVLNDSVSNVTVRNCPSVSGYDYGVYAYQSSDSVLSNITAQSNSQYGFYDFSGTGNRLNNDTAYGNIRYGFYLDGSSGDNLSGDNSSGNPGDISYQGTGFYLDSANGNVLADNTAGDNPGYGFYLTVSSGNNLTGNVAFNASNTGFSLQSGTGNNLSNNGASGSGTGFSLYSETSDTLSGNRAFNNTYTGTWIADSDLISLISEYYSTSGNGLDILEDTGATVSYNASGIIIDGPAGGYRNYTNLSISDTLSLEEYAISWSTNYSALPENRTSFAQKFADISPIWGSPSIDSITWNWQNSELQPTDNESTFGVWRFDVDWVDRNATLDTGANTLTLSDEVPGSIYGILESNVSTGGGNVSVSLESPSAGYNATRRATTFNCSANASSGLYNITLYGNFTGTWQANRTNIVGGTTNSTAFTLNLSYARYSWNCLAYDTDGNSAWAPANYTFTADSLPLDSNFGGSTTDFNNELDLQNVSTPILENTTHGKLQWNQSGLDVAGADFNSYVLFGTGWVSVDSSHLSPTLNSPANITLYGLPYQYTPLVYSDGALCTGCTLLSYVSHNLAFTVPHFTNYSAGPNTNLTIYDQYEGSNVSKLTPITFYANYTNATDGSYISGATCLISFDDATSATMADTGNQYNYTKAAGFATTGIHLWNVTCNKTGYETLFVQDNVDVGPLNLTGNQTSLYMANVTNATSLPRFEYNGSGNLSTEGGNISGADVSTEMLTDRWAAFYGNISGSIMLTDAAGANNVYQWGWTPASGGVVCTSTNSSVTDLTLYPADGDDIDAAWSFAPTEADSGRNTFNQTGCSLTIGTTPITNAGYADTGQAGGFITCSLKAEIPATKPDMFFCTNITQNGVFWNNEAGDFELMVPTAFGNNVYETYYFYVNLD